MRLHDLIHNREPQARAAHKIGLQGLKYFCALSRIQAHSRVAEADAHPEGRGFQGDGQNSTGGHGAERVVGQIPEHLLDAVAIDANADLGSREGSLDAVFSIDLRAAFQQRQSFIQKDGDIFLGKFVGFFARIIQELGNDFVEALRFPAHNPHQVLFVFRHRHQAAQLLYGSGHGRKRLANFVRNGRGKAPERGHAFFGGYFLFQALQVREVLEIENVSGGAALSGTKRGN